ncbi:MAG TPA: hypothetical protein VMF58_05795 [Rhizomicrobium sp.]|nr:hypothetical protein [Rhizomicrobium sp.]
MRRIVVLCAALLASGCATHMPEAPHVLDIDNRVPRFETFYADATAKPIDADARFALWKKEDGLAAVPPGPDGDEMARHLLDAAWSRYPALVPQLPALEKAAEEEGRNSFQKINALLGTEGVPIETRLVLYVGQFDNNAFTAPAMGGKPVTVLMPVENAILKIALAHELTHSVHMQLAHVKNSFGAPVGETMFLEGLAMRTSQAAVPGLDEKAYTQIDPNEHWLANCYAKQDAVLKGILPDLAKSGQEIGMKYTFGQGNTGMQREAYCAAWIVMGKLMASGKTLPELARIPEDKMVDTIRAAMAAK